MNSKLMVVSLALATGVFAAPMRVQVRQGQVRGTPSQLGAVVATVEYGTVVEAGALQNGWYPVTVAATTRGWLHQSALAKRGGAMKAGATDVNTGATADEVALAGKGFNEQVEKQLKAAGQLDFTWVDRLSASQVGADQIVDFRRQGELPGGER